MREIRFRGKCVDDNEWAYGDYYSSDEMPMRGEVGHFIKCGLNEEYMIIPETIGQYTGLKDKNGKEIYEGDLCQRKYMKNGIEVIELYEVVYDVGMFTCEKIGARGLSSSLGYYCTNVKMLIEVIGNKFENPELIE